MDPLPKSPQRVNPVHPVVASILFSTSLRGRLIAIMIALHSHSRHAIVSLRTCRQAEEFARSKVWGNKFRA